MNIDHLKDKFDLNELEVSLLEYIKKNQKQLNVVLKEDTKVLDEVIVIGYGTTTRKSAVGAVDQVKASMIEDVPWLT